MLDKNSRELKDFVKFGTAMINSGDADPQFWPMREYYRRHRLSTNTALWFSFLYLVWYHLGSASIAWQHYPEPEIMRSKNWDPTLVYFKQRRLFRGNTYARTHINAALEATDGDLAAWVCRAVGDGGKEGWGRVRETYQALPYTGPWSSYKWCDIIKWVHGYPITAPDIGNKPGNTAGPIAGLSSLTKLPREECANNPKIYKYLYDLVTDEFDMPLIGLDHLESCLCDWQSITNGRYYHGLDIDRDLMQLSAYPKNEVSKELYKIRSRIFDHRLLGEKHDHLFGWSRIRLELKTRYRRQQELVNIFEDVKKVKLL